MMAVVTSSFSSTQTVTQEESEAFLWMQGRMFELLLRHNASQFGRTFDERTALPDWLEDARFQHYRELAVVVYLQGELFEHILPRIKRRLSFEAPRVTQLEELPARGRIDWTHTASANWQNFPEEVPLEVHTRQHRRHFATPENLLTVVTILEYRQIVQRLLDDEANRDALQALSHPLNNIVELCNRELAFLQFAGLLTQCQEIVSGYTDLTTEELEQRVTNNLLPGHNSAYSDLLDWRQRLWNLRLLDRTPDQTFQAMLGSDPDRDNYLYQLWLFYEIGDLLQELGKLEEWDHFGMKLSFKWGEAAEERKYRLQHDKAILGIPKKWKNTPGVRPDLYVERINPPSQQVTAGNVTVWRETGFILDAKYYKPRANTKAPGEPVKRMLTDLNLTGTQHGALLFAFLGSKSQQDDETEPGPEYQITPEFSDPRVMRQTSIEVHRFCPTLDSEESFRLKNQFVALLETIHQKLVPAPKIACHGFFLDVATSNQDGIGRTEPELLGLPHLLIPSDSRWLVCPKPHLGPGVADIVNSSQDCLKKPHLCHVMGFPDVRLPFQIPRKIEDLQNALKLLKSRTITSYDAETVQQVQQEFIDFTRRYAELAGEKLEYYYRQFQDEHLLDFWEVHPLLTSQHKEALALGKFLQDQITRIGGTDYSGPGLHFSFVFEALISATIFNNCEGLTGYWKTKKGQTLGVLPMIYKYRNSLEPQHEVDRLDWPVIEEHAKKRWVVKVSDTPSVEVEFAQFIRQIEPVSDYRNKAAHPGPLTKNELVKLWNFLFVKTNDFSLGLIPTLLSAWRST